MSKKKKKRKIQTDAPQAVKPIEEAAILSPRVSTVSIAITIFILFITHYFLTSYFLKFPDTMTFPFGSDMKTYRAWSLSLAKNIPQNSSFYYAPLYAYTFAGFIKIFGDTPLLLHLSNILFLCLDIFFIERIAYFILRSEIPFFNEVSKKKTAIFLSLIFFAFSPQIQLFAHIQAIAIFSLSIDLAFILSSILWMKKKNGSFSALTGLLLGLACVARGNHVFLIPFWAFGIFYFQPEDKIKIKISSLFIFLLFLSIPISFTSIHNFNAAGTFIPLTTNGPGNFFIGNHPGARGVFQMRSLGAWKKSLGGDPGTQKMLHALIHWITSNPKAYITLLWDKFTFLFTKHDIAQNLDFIFFTKKISLLRFLASFLNFTFYASFGILGLCRLYPWKPNRYPILFFLLIYSFSIVLFFVVGRFRIPLIPFLCIGSGIYWSHIIHSLKTPSLPNRGFLFFLTLLALGFCILPEDQKPFSFWILLFIIVFLSAKELLFTDSQQTGFYKHSIILASLLCLIAWWSATPPQSILDMQKGEEVRKIFNDAIILSNHHHPREAAEQYRKVISIKKDYMRAWFELSLALKESGKPDQAEKSMRQYLQFPDAKKTKGKLFLAKLYAEQSAYKKNDIPFQLKANRLFSSFKDEEKQSENYFRYYSSFLSNIGKNEQAIHILKTGIQKFNHSNKLQAILSVCLYKKGSFQEAGKWALKALQNNSSEPNAMMIQKRLLRFKTKSSLK